MDRRSFIKLTAITGTSATIAACGSPADLDHQLIRFVPDDDLTPGIAEWKPSICPLCRGGCGLHVRVMDADAEVIRKGELGQMRIKAAKKLEGHPNHPINQGALCARGQAGVQVTYHPDRLTHPLKRSGPRGSGQFQEISWDDALRELVSKLDALAASGRERSLAFWTRPRYGLRRELIALFLSRFGAPQQVTYELFGEHVLRRANLLSFGRAQLPTFDLARSRYVLAFGADFLGTWNSPVAQSVAYGRMRQGRPGIRGKFVHVEPRMSQTGANADEWIPARPGTEGALALGVAHVLMGAQLRPASAAGAAGALIEGWNGLADYTPAKVEARTGVAAARIERIAHEMADMQPAVVIIGGAPLAHTNGLSQALAANALNALLGNVGRPGGLLFTPQTRLPAIVKEAPPSGASSSLETLASSPAFAAFADARSPIQVLLVDEANPVFAAPAAWRVREAMDKIPFIASFGSFLDDTSVLADLILPDHSFLESWVDAAPESGASVGVVGVAAPVMRPLHQTRAMPDVLLDVSRTLARPLSPALPWQTFEEMLHAGVASLARGDDAWSTAQQQGGVWGDALAGAIDKPDAQPRGLAMPLADAQFDGASAEYPFHFLPYASSAFLDGSLAHLPWLQEMPDPITSAMWSSWVEINPKTAAAMKISQGDVVEITSRHGSVRAPALLWPGLAPDVIAMPVGQGHRTFTRYASGRGDNPIAILAPVLEHDTGALAWAATRVKIARAGDADGSLILFAAEMREHPDERR